MKYPSFFQKLRKEPSSTENKLADGIRPYSDDGISTALEGLGRGTGTTQDVPERYGNHGLHHDPNPVVAKMNLGQQIKSKIPFTRENKLRKAAASEVHKDKNYIKTTAQKVLEAIEARDAHVPDNTLKNSAEASKSSVAAPQPVVV